MPTNEVLLPNVNREVYTDSADFIGPKDTEMCIEAFTVSCGVITFHNEQGVAGIIHVSMGDKVQKVLGEAIYKAQSQGLQLGDFTLRRFKGSEQIWRDTEKAFANFGLKLPKWETTIEPGIRINKSTGEVSFYV